MTALRLCGQVVARVDDSKVEIFEVDGSKVRSVDRFVADAPIAWIELAPDGRSALVRDPSARQSWWWRRGVGLERLVTAASPRDPFGCGYVTIGGASVVLIAHAGRLRGLDLHGEVLFEANLGKPRPFHPSSFVELPGGRLALVGHEPDDPFTMIATVITERLVSDPQTVHVALTTLAPVWDRAVALAVGAGPSTTAVVFRDPDGEEEADDFDSDHVGGDVVAFTGFYLRELATGALVQRIEFGKGVGGMLHASERSILAFAGGKVIEIDRATAVVTELAGTAVTFDRGTGRIARLDAAGRIELI
jgi:hypothetical protein